MKKTLQIIAVILIALGCSKSPQTEAENTIQAWVKTELNDYSSYESIEFGDIELSTPAFEEENAQTLEQFKRISQEYSKQLLEYNSYIESNEVGLAELSRVMVELLGDSLEKASQQIENLRANWKPDTFEHKVRHKFRAKNEQGVMEQHYYLFSLTKDLAGVKGVIDLKTNESIR